MMIALATRPTFSILISILSMFRTQVLGKRARGMCGPAKRTAAGEMVTNRAAVARRLESILCVVG